MRKRKSPTASPVSHEGNILVRALRRNAPEYLCGLLVLLTVLLYLPATRNDFVDYDDGDYVTGNPHVQAGLNWKSVGWAFTSGHASNWHPLTWVTHMLDITLFGKEAGGHHLTNIILHGLNTALVFLVLRQLTQRPWRSLVVAALFAVHPLHVESVAWVSERKDVLSACFALLTLWAYARHAQNIRAVGPNAAPVIMFFALRFYGLALLFFALGLMSKPMLVTLPFAMLLLDYWPLRRLLDAPPFKALWDLVIEKIPFFCLATASSIVTFLVQQKGGAVSTALAPTERGANALVSYLRYLGKTIWPTNLSVLYPHPGEWAWGLVISAAVLLIATTALALIFRKKIPFVAVGWLWFVGMMVPVIGLVQVGMQSMADRYTYLPHIGLFVAVVWGAAEICERWPKFKPAWVALVLVFLSFAVVQTNSQIRIWKNTETLFTQAINVTQKNYLAYNNLGFYVSKKGREAEAIAYYRKSLEINPDYEEPLNNLGRALANQGKLNEAISLYQRALQTGTNKAEIHNNLANALADTGNIDAAMGHYWFVLKQNPQHVNALNGLGICFAQRGRMAEAFTNFNAALRLSPNDATTQVNLGNAYAIQKNFGEAEKHYQHALRAAPNDQTYFNLGIALGEQKRPEEALTNYLFAVRLKPENFQAHYAAALTLAQLGRREESRERLREVLRLKPDYQEARQLLESLGPP